MAVGAMTPAEFEQHTLRLIEQARQYEREAQAQLALAERMAAQAHCRTAALESVLATHRVTVTRVTARRERSLHKVERKAQATTMQPMISFKPTSKTAVRHAGETCDHCGGQCFVIEDEQQGGLDLKCMACGRTKQSYARRTRNRGDGMELVPELTDEAARRPWVQPEVLAAHRERTA